ncbi:hypothetical protein BD289DRAFT_441368 [Coniella lustricola]|uniref:Rieske domain-containing protein n=1 Tax=Coniella lustricola TaxID=2025994 RepID=A0A2T2ZZH6_9PEZI|nr:hypothetical protein BD289DRAFT_441368 [Coniella lustricola]
MASTSPTTTPSTNNEADEPWLFAGLASSFPNINDSSEPCFKLSWAQPLPPLLPCPSLTTPPDIQPKAPGCKVFHPKRNTTNTTTTTTLHEIDTDTAIGEDAWLMREQVLVFRYKGRFHAVDHACPHRAYSLSWAQPFEIEDSGRVLGTGIRCRGHGYAFELSTGIGDRGEYRLGVWDVELRDCIRGGDDSEEGAGGREDVDREVWIRKRKRTKGSKVMQSAGE